MAETTIPSDAGIDLKNRDPVNLNSNIRTLWEDSFGEPEGTHSRDGVWTCSFKTYHFVKACCYMILSLLCAGPAACCWGASFACQSCMSIWCTTPCMKSLDLQLACLASCIDKIVHCCCDPVCSACGLLLSKVTLHHKYEVV